MSGALIMVAGMAALIGIVHHYGAAVSTWDLTPGWRWPAWAWAP
jgi:hypothetical protein